MIAIWTGRKIRWDAKREEIADDPGASQFLTRALRAQGLRVVITSPRRHDRWIAETLFLPQFIGRALARAQARLGMIPVPAADVISKAAFANDFDVDAISQDARTSASIAIPLVKALTARVAAVNQDGAAYVHWGATSQDALDTTMSLLLVRAHAVFDRDRARRVRRGLGRPPAQRLTKSITTPSGARSL